MALKQIPITKGLFLDVDPIEIGSTEYAAVLENIMISKALSNVDRPDFLSFASTGGAFGVTGLYFFAGFLLAVTVDRRVYTIDITGAVTDITGASTLQGTAKPRFIDDGSVVLILGGQTPLSWDGVAAGCITAVGPPPDCEFMEYLDGYFLTPNEATNIIQYSGPADRTVWSAGDFFSKEGKPDPVVSIYVLLRELWAFGTDSIETWQNFGDSSVPFQRTFFIDRGCAAPRSVVEANNTLFFLDDERHFVRMDGRTPVFISDQIDTILKAEDFIFGDCFGQKIEIDGFYLIAWVFPSMKRCFVHDYRSGEWAEWSGWVGQSKTLIPINCHQYVKGWGKHLVGDPSTGTIWQLTRAAKGTQAAPMRRIRTTGFYDHGVGTRKRSNFYLFHVLRGQGTPGQPEPFFEVRVNDDNGGWTDPIPCPLGYPGATQEPMRIQVGGIYRKRQLEIMTTAAIDFKLVKIEEDVELMTS